MENLQLLLSPRKDVAADLTVSRSGDGLRLYVYLGVSLLESVPADAGCPAYRMLLGRLVNAGHRICVLSRQFGHDERTLRRWADAVADGSPEALAKMWSGRGGEARATREVRAFVKLQYRDLRGRRRRYRKEIRGQVAYVFAETLSRETLRLIFREADREDAACRGGSPEGTVDAVTGCPSPPVPDSEPDNPTPVPDRPRQPLLPLEEGVDPATPEAHAENVPAPSPAVTCPSPPACSPQSDNRTPAVPDVRRKESRAEGESGTAAIAQTPAAADRTSSSPAPSPAVTCPLPPACSPQSDNRTPAVPDGGRPDRLPWEGRRAPAVLQTVHHAGLVLFSLWMDVFRAAREAVAGIQIQWLCQILQGAVNLEQAGRVSVGDIGWFTAPLDGPVATQRKRLDDTASLENVMDVYEANARLLPDGPGNGDIFFYDPTAKHCNSARKLLKGWCGGLHAVAKVMYLDMIHTVSGFVCFIQHYDAYSDLRERTFITLDLFDRLFPPAGRRGRTFVMDRGIYGLETLGRFLDRGDYVLTWEKGYRGDGWRDDLPAECFAEFRLRNGPDDRREYEFSVQSSPWDRDPRFRRIVVRAVNPEDNLREVAILCPNPALTDRRATVLMFSRWIQENCIRGLNRHAGLMQATSYDVQPYRDIADQLRDRPVDCPQYRELKKQRHDAEKTLGKLLVDDDRDRRETDRLNRDIERLEARRTALTAVMLALLEQLRNAAPGDTGPDPDPLIRERAELRRRRRKLERRLTTVEDHRSRRQPLVENARNRMEALDCEIEETLRTGSRLRLLINARYERLDTRKKALMDACRITAANMFRLLLGAFRPIYGNRRNDEALLRMLTRADGFIVETNGVVRIGLWLKGTYQPRQMTAFRIFLWNMTRAINAQFAGRRAPVELVIVRSPDQLTARNPGEMPAFNLS